MDLRPLCGFPHKLYGSPTPDLCAAWFPPFLVAVSIWFRSLPPGSRRAKHPSTTTSHPKYVVSSPFSGGHALPASGTSCSPGCSRTLLLLFPLLNVPLLEQELLFPHQQAAPAGFVQGSLAVHRYVCSTWWGYLAGGRPYRRLVFCRFSLCS